MIKFYFSAAPNPVKVALALEEMGLPYEPIPVDTRKSEQFTPEFLAINPNAKVPAIDDDGQVVFDSNAILLYLADKTNQFVPAIGSDQRGAMLSWLMFVASGVGPFSGQAVHFRNFAPEPNPYALNRYDYEAERHWKLVDDQLGKGQYMLGDQYTIVDMAVWGWARMVPFVLGNENAWDDLPNLKRLLDEVSARPAADKVEALRTSHKFKTELDDEARKSMFPQNARL
jgi:GST-like protein